MNIKRFSIVFGFVATASGASAAPPHVGDAALLASDSGIVFIQGFKERQLEELPAVDAGRAQPPARTGPPPPPPVPTAPRITTRTAPPPAGDDDGPPAREVPPPPSSSTRYTPPPPPPPPARAPTSLHEPTPTYRTAPPPPAAAAPPPRPTPPAYDEPPPPRRADAPKRPATRSAFYANCTQQCHMSCEATFEACNGDSSPAKPACVKKLETCRVERCSCRFD